MSSGGSPKGCSHMRLLPRPLPSPTPSPQLRPKKPSPRSPTPTSIVLVVAMLVLPIFDKPGNAKTASSFYKRRLLCSSPHGHGLWANTLQPVATLEWVTTAVFRCRGGCTSPLVREDIDVHELERLKKLSLSPTKTTRKMHIDNDADEEFSRDTVDNKKNSTSQKHIDFWKDVSGGGEPRAMYNLGLCYYAGAGVAQNYETAVEWFTRASEKGFAEADHNLGVCHQLGRGVRQDQQSAIEFYEAAASKNVSDSMNNLGMMYQKGLGIPRNLSRAYEWFRKGADAGNPEAMFNVAMAYYKGAGHPTNLSEAFRMLNSAVVTNCKSKAKAMYMLGNMYASGEHTGSSNGYPDYKEALDWFRMSADLGYPEGQLMAGKTIIGKESRKKTPSAVEMQKGVSYLEAAASKSLAQAFFELAVVYTEGYLGQKDPQKAVHWLQKAADAGHKSAWGMLGAAFMNGEGVEKDHMKAFEWLQKAAQAGNSDCMVQLGEMFSEGTEAVEKDYEEAYEWFEKAAFAGSKEGMVWLATSKIYGRGCEANLREAREWLSKAIAQGSKRASALYEQFFG